MTAGRVVCWRHGRTGHNHVGIWQGQLDIPLDAVGHAQAREAAAAIATSLTPGEPLAVISSDLGRAGVTAAALAARTGADVHLDPRLREMNAGRWQGMTRVAIIEAGMGDDLVAWQRGDDVRVGGGERRSEVARRAAAALREQADATAARSSSWPTEGCSAGSSSTSWDCPDNAGTCSAASATPTGRS